MSYRDELQAALARIASLERELVEAKRVVPEAPAAEPEPEPEPDEDPERARIVDEIRQALAKLDRPRRNTFLLEQAVRVLPRFEAVFGPDKQLRAAMLVAREYIDGRATLAQLEEAFDETASVCERADHTLTDAQTARVSALDAAAQAASKTGDTSQLGALLDGPDPSKKMYEAVNAGFVVLTLLGALQPQCDDDDAADALADVADEGLIEQLRTAS